VRGGPTAGLVDGASEMEEERPIEMEDWTRTLLRSVRCAVAGATLVALLACNAPAAFAACPNESFRTGRSASLPDCRAYELVTPPELGRTADMTFKDEHEKFSVSSEGERFLLEAEVAAFEPAASRAGTKAVFSRTPSGWTIQSATTPAMTAEATEISLLSRDFSQAALVSNEVPLNPVYHFAVGPVGGPYATLSVPRELGGADTFLVGANPGVPGGVAPFTDVFLTSLDHALLPPGPEREAAEETQPGLVDLYGWSGGQLRLVNVDDEGKLLNQCGAKLGGAAEAERGSGNAINAVSPDGSRVFFVSPAVSELPGCPQAQLYMRVDGRETVEVSAPQGLTVPLSERGRARYVGASRDGSRVYFTTATVLTPEGGSGALLYEYDTDAPVGHRLKLIAENVVLGPTANPGAVVSEDGSTVYYFGTSTLQEPGKSVAVRGIWRYDAISKTTSFVAVPREADRAGEPWYVTPDGGSLVFPSGGPTIPAVQFDGPEGLEEELRGVGHDELYRYDAADGSVMCVSCGEGVPPAKGLMLEPILNEGWQERSDNQPTPVMISEDRRRVFFQTSAQLVPQDTNENTLLEELDSIKSGLGKASDVYEWEADGSEEAPGVFCRVANGCTHLISAGEAVGPERFLGASQNGQDLYFASAAQLVPQATPEFTNIYDARVDGGFPSPAPHVECSSCQGVGSPPPQFSTPASAAFTGVGNPPASSPAPPPSTHVVARKRCLKGKRLSHGRCVKAAKRKTRKAAGSRRRSG
jgi:hypothetical protein